MYSKTLPWPISFIFSSCSPWDGCQVLHVGVQWPLVLLLRMCNRNMLFLTVGECGWVGVGMGWWACGCQAT